jgi:hypothetical protein|tara:strand:- start:119 stop:382 length:264 start_codon:yes stop_codon:yes gene_type:complete
MSINFNNLTRRFLLGEERSKSSIFTYIQGLQETLTNFTPRSKTESRRVSIAREQLREIKRYARKLQNEVELLQERLNILEEQVGPKE